MTHLQELYEQPRQTDVSEWEHQQKRLNQQQQDEGGAAARDRPQRGDLLRCHLPRDNHLGGDCVRQGED